MNLKKSALSIALASALCTGTTQADIIDMSYEGLFTMLDPGGVSLQNTSYPYYGDPIWGYGLRTQISGTMQFDTDTGAGTGTVNPFEFFSRGPLYTTSVEFQAIGDGAGGPGSLIIGNMNLIWNSNSITTQIILDGAGLFAELPTAVIGDMYNATTCTASGACATPTSNDINNGKFPIDPVPIATTSFNVDGATGLSTTLDQLSLGTDDGIGGSPMDNGPTSGFNMNFDFTTLQVTDVVTSVPIPATVWLFGAGLFTLSGVARKKRHN